MTIPDRPIAGLLLAAAVLTASPAGAEEDEARIPAAVQVFEGIGPDVFLLPEVRYGDAYVAERPEPIVEDGLTETLRALVEGELGVRGGALQTDGDTLIAIGPDDAVRFAVERVSAIRRFLEGAAEVGIAVASLPAPPASAPSAAELSALVRSGDAKLLWSTRVVTRRGAPTRREALTSKRFLYFLTEEISQGASVAAPETAELVGGVRASVHCRAISSRRAAVTLSLQVSRLPDAMRTVTVSSGTVDLPAVPFVSLLAPLVLEPGGSEVLLVPDPTGGGALAVAVTLRKLAGAGGLPFDLVDLTALAGFPETVDGLVFPGVLEEDDERLPLLETGHDADLDDALLERIGDLGVRMEEVLPGIGALLGPDAARSEALRLVHDAARPATVVRVRRRLPWKDVATAAWFDPLLGTVDPEELAKLAAGPRLRLPVRKATPTIVFAGTWRRFLVGVNVSSAQNAVVTTPAIRDFFEGETIVTRIGDDGRAHVLRRGATLLDLGNRKVAVVRDVEGRRSSASEDQVDALEAVATEIETRVDREGAVDVRREGDTGIVDAYLLR